MNAHVRGVTATVGTGVVVVLYFERFNLDPTFTSVLPWVLVVLALWPLSTAFSSAEKRHRQDFRTGMGWYLVGMAMSGFFGLLREGGASGGPIGAIAACFVFSMFGVGVVWGNMSAVEHYNGGLAAGFRRLKHPRKRLIRDIMFGGVGTGIALTILIGLLGSIR